MNKTDYLAEIGGFIDYFYKIITKNESINYSYTIKHAAWLKWAKANKYTDAKNRITYARWSDLLEKYYWAGGDYQANKDKLDGLIVKIDSAVTNGGNAQILVESTRILDWGQTYKGSISWLLKRYDKEDLVDRLNDAVRILDGDEWGKDEISQYEKGKILMDSGLTKIISLASKKSIIYDGRTGAALAYLVVQYLKTKVPVVNEIPDNLKFAVDKSKKDSSRNPKYKKSIFRNKTTKLAHAESNLWANWIIGSIVDRAGKRKDKGKSIFNREINGDNYSQCIREIEAALFMMGSRIDGR